MRRLAREALKFLFWYPVAELALLTPLAAAYAIANIVGRTYALLSRSRARLIRQEIGKLLGKSAEEVPAETARRTCALFAKNQLEFLRAPRLTRELMALLVTIEGKGYLDAALARGSGAILLLIHYGANQLIIPAIKHQGYDLLQFGSPPGAWHDLHGREPSWLDRRIFARRLSVEQALGVEFLYIERSLRPAYRALTRNRVLAIALDGRYGSRFEPIPFGARTAMLSPGPVGLAFRTGAALLPTFIERQSDDRHQLVIHPPMAVAGPDGEPIPPVAVLTEFAGLAMGYIARSPCHYGWLLQAARHRAPIDRVPLFADLRKPRSSC